MRDLGSSFHLAGPTAVVQTLACRLTPYRVLSFQDRPASSCGPWQGSCRRETSSPVSPSVSFSARSTSATAPSPITPWNRECPRQAVWMCPEGKAVQTLGVGRMPRHCGLSKRLWLSKCGIYAPNMIAKSVGQYAIKSRPRRNVS